ncbi:MAG: hypothetical protein HYY67_06025 [Thaumarchaeota archaeon]|nr:hypothetical protein [Nitrososphaerota archaeon]
MIQVELIKWKLYIKTQEYYMNKEDKKKCSACGADSFRIRAKDTKKDASFRLEEIEIIDIQKGEAIPIMGNLFINTYSCTSCRHLDFYGINVSEGNIMP